MTGGVAVILGAVGDNFAAGMTGGMAFVYDVAGTFQIRLNPDSVVSQRIESTYWEERLLALIEEHATETKSAHARAILDQWTTARGRFWQICPKEMLSRLRHPLRDAASAMTA
jgi:glutamate synthase (NADPH/NADH) large chain